MLLFPPVPANLSRLRIVALDLPAAAHHFPRHERWCALGQVFETINQLPVQVWNLLLDDVHDHVAHVPQRLRPEPRLAIVTGLQCEHVAALAFRLRLLLGVLGAVMLADVVADDAPVVSALADQLLALRANTNEAAPEKLTGTYGVGRPLLIEDSSLTSWP